MATQTVIDFKKKYQSKVRLIPIIYSSGGELTAELIEEYLLEIFGRNRNRPHIVVEPDRRDTLDISNPSDTGSFIGEIPIRVATNMRHRDIVLWGHLNNN